MKELRIHFVDFWPNFQPDDNYFFNLLSLRYKVVIDPINPELLFYSYDYTGEKQHTHFQKSRCKKIYYTGENSQPNFNECDFAFTFDPSPDLRNYRLPLWVLHLNWFNRPYRSSRDQAYLHPPELLLNKHDRLIKASDNAQRSFCCFIATQDKGPRAAFYNTLTQRKPVDAGGKLCNSLGFSVPGRGDEVFKVKFVERYRFCMAFENTSAPGYTTEKIIQPMFADTIPIYWGSSLVTQDFNQQSFVNCHAFSNFDEVVEKVIALENNAPAYREMLLEPWFLNNQIPTFAQPETVLQFFERTII